MTDGAEWFTLFRSFLPIDRCGEGDDAGDVEVVGESAAVYLFGQVVVAGGEVEQTDMGIDGSGVVGGGKILRLCEISNSFLGKID